MQAFRTEINFAIKICGTRKKIFTDYSGGLEPQTACFSRQYDCKSRAIVKLDVYHRCLNRGRGQKPQEEVDKVNRREIEVEKERHRK